MLQSAAPRPLTILKTRSQPVEATTIAMGALAAALIGAVFCAWLSAQADPVRQADQLRAVQNITLS